MAQVNLIEPIRLENLTSFVRSSVVPESLVKHNTVYFSSNDNYLSDKFIWNINGANLEVYSYNSKCVNRLHGLFEFGKIFQDDTIAITSVTRLTDPFEVSAKFRHPHKLIVILSLTSTKSLICIVDIRLNRVLNTIDFPFNATCAQVVLSGTPEGVEKWPLARELSCMNGILAVGCDGGIVFFIDLVLDSYSPVPLIPKQIYFIAHSPQTDLASKRRTAIFHNQVICIPLNTDAKSKGKFSYRSAKGDLITAYSSQQVYVSAIHYIPQLALIAVGYNFGGFHLYNINTLQLDFTNEIDSSFLPVVSFAFQVPENDPKNFSYLWAVRGICAKTPNLEETVLNSCSNASLYLICYESKCCHRNYGYLYSNFKMCVLKYNMTLPFNPHDQNSHHHSSSKLIDMFTIHQVSSIGLLEDDPSTASTIDYNLVFLSWTARNLSETKHISRNSYFLIFDLNQWYNSQMPPQFCIDGNGHCPFISIYSLNSLEKMVTPDSVQSIYVHNNSISKYNSNLFYHDIHSYPASLSFNITVTSQTKICNASYMGLQKQELHRFLQTGPYLLEQPQGAISKCFQLGLVAPEYELSESISDRVAREVLMNIALDNSLTPFLINTIKEWATGLNADIGCDLKHILDWIWKKVTSIKESIDSLTTSLFDFSGTDLMPHDMSKLFSHQVNLSALSVLLKQLRVHATVLTQQGHDQLVTRCEIVELISHYLKIILYFKGIKLLPEQDKPNQLDDSISFYSYEKCAQYYTKRRKQVNSINPAALKNDDVLLIDTLVRHLEPQIGVLWKTPGSRSKFLYPPPNIYSLLRIFLVDTIPLVYKESLLLYFLMDFCDNLEEEHVNMAQQIVLFMSSLQLSEGTRNFVRGIWFLDHQKLSSALQLLTHPIVTCALGEFKVDVSMFNAIIRRAVQLFLFANEHKSALIFTQCCGHFLVDTQKNENLYIQLLLLNGNLAGAIDFERQRRGNPNAAYLVHNLFFVCEKTNNLNKLVRFPLDDFEEESLVQYLFSSPQPNAKRMLILYYTFNNKLLEAISVAREFSHQLDMSLEENKCILELTEAYNSRVPQSLSDLANEMTHIISKNVESASQEFPGAQRIISDETTIKINAKQKGMKKISTTTSIEKVLELQEAGLRRNAASNHLTPNRPRPMYLSPNVSRMQSKVIKAKHQNSGARDLFSVLRTPDVIRKMDVRAQNSSLGDSQRKPSILKHADTSSVSHDEGGESDRVSERSTHSKLRVSFDIEGRSEGRPKTARGRVAKGAAGGVAFGDVAESQTGDDDSSIADNSECDPEELNNQDTDSDSSRRRSTRATRSETPTHRMKLRNKKPA